MIPELPILIDIVLAPPVAIKFEPPKAVGYIQHSNVKACPAEKSIMLDAGAIKY
jgi:hypothetical protein